MSYQPTQKEDRLRKQAELFSLMHNKGLELAKRRLADPACFVDIGCGQGYGMHGLNFKKVIGIDKNPEALASAQKKFPEYRFIEMDAQSPDFAEKLKEELPDKPVLARLSLSLHHMENPVETLKSLQQTLPRGSALLVLSPDQEMSCAFPSVTFDRLVELWKQSPSLFYDTSHGRKLASQMREAGLLQITALPYIFTTAGVDDAVKRELLFSVFNEFRLGDWEDLDAPGELEEMHCLLEDLAAEFRSPEFFFMATMFIGLGRV